MSDIILRAEHLSKAFIGVQALHDVSVDIRAGQILCLVGENGSGKSTFVKTVSGVYAPDSGIIRLGETPYKHLTPQQAMDCGVQVIYQDLSLFPHMSVAENIAINTLRQSGARLIDWRRVREIAQAQTEKIGVQLNLSASVMETSMANRQLTAICRALAQDAKILFMDEPTTALTKREVDNLLKVVGELKASGLAVVFISHKLDEVFEVADTITIFRDGKKIGDFLSGELDHKKLVFHMTGRDVVYPHYRRTSADDAPLLELKGLTKKGSFEDISLKIRRGDIFALTGLLGAGRTELALALFGLNPWESGEALFCGKPIRPTSPAEAKKIGIALLPEDRATQGLFLSRSIRENVSSAVVDQLGNRAGILDHARERRLAEDSVKRLSVRTPSIETKIGSLSGGNQQKAVVAKWANTNPQLLIMDMPTVGVDIGSKAEIYELIQGYARRGVAVLLITDEMEELIANASRVMVMAAHRQVATLTEADLQRPDAAARIAALIGGGTAKAGDAS